MLGVYRLKLLIEKSRKNSILINDEVCFFKEIFGTYW